MVDIATMRKLDPEQFSEAADGYHAVGSMAEEAKGKVDDHIVGKMARETGRRRCEGG
ncbi:hypothetical protein [Streptomyces sp. NRRL F-5053]|uniref:hypothetical protein n=1 Tax=Streptomyces sp. NRRL F-5053 TaxID=1463854 RepID=UPI000B33170A|nr:hypothetical protein [Streptomyces sp. NRRL F-5053]